MEHRIFDAHAHYFDRRFSSEYEGGADAVLEKEVFGGPVSHVVNVGTNPTNSLSAIAMAQMYDGMYATVGIHPEDAQFLPGTVDEEMEILRNILGSESERKEWKIVALGEIGLDYHLGRDGSFVPDKALQAEYFERQLCLAEELGLPVVIHDRDAHGDCFEAVLRHPKVKGVFHSYSGSAEMAAELIRRGWYISFSGVVTFHNAKRVREVVETIPMEWMLIETDAPYLAPHPHRGTLNHSGRMTYTASAIAAVKGISAEEVIRITAENAARLYGVTLG